MRFIAITTPKVVVEDVYLIQRLLDGGIDIIHLRKPEADIRECRKLLKKLTKGERAKIVIHDFPELYYEFSKENLPQRF